MVALPRETLVLGRLDYLLLALDFLRSLRHQAVQRLHGVEEFLDHLVDHVANRAHRAEGAHDLATGVEAHRLGPGGVAMAAYDGLAVYVTMMPDIDLDRVSEVFVETLLSGLVVRENGQESD